MFGFHGNKCKPQLKMAVHRIELVKNKKANAAQAERKEIAQFLRDGKEEKARLRVERIIRDDSLVEGYEILALLCELVAERMTLIESQKQCPFDLKESICTLVWASSRTEIPELIEVKKQMIKKYGQDFVTAAEQNRKGCVNERVISNLGVELPSAYLVINYLKEIAKQYKVRWESESNDVVDPLAPLPAPTGTSVRAAGVSGPDFAAVFASAPMKTDVTKETAVPAAKENENPSESSLSSSDKHKIWQNRIDSAHSARDATSFNEQIPNFDELTARFERLRNPTDSDSRI
uniref:Uncharacterized protein AlNc14C184G8285 n=1 Tax=Albugo laibachii Nc14 TaxID=890382 RepID=F0WPE0_9STRA|nr:conserved hypothetical protein [Albugo laibachii Nc14]|eukprot:CCA23187.1 conserved hypothetical protein [Albugo laibachii Nc14]